LPTLLASSSLRDRADGAGRAERLAPVARVERLERFLELGGGRDLRGAKGGGREAAVGEVAHRQADAADLERLGAQRPGPAPEDHLGRAPADVDHQPGLVGRLETRHAGVDQAGFLATGDHLDRQAERLARAREELVAVARLAQRLRRDRPHLIGPVALEPLLEPRQAGEPARRPPRRSAGRRRRGRRRAAPSPSGSRCAGSGRRRARRSRAGSCSTPCRPQRAGPASAVRCRIRGESSCIGALWRRTRRGLSADRPNRPF
jgi:hypothetical protein